MKWKVKTLKWVLGFVALVIIFLTLVKMAVQIYYMGQNGWDMSSFSTWYLCLALILSVLFVSMTFLEKVAYGQDLKHPEQIMVFVLGVTGIIFSILLLIMKIKDGGVLFSG